MRVIILAAGQGFKLDGCNKILLKDPKTNKMIIDQYIEIFSEFDITVVVGYKAIEIIQVHPNLNYIYNDEWNISNNSYSLGLALDDRPCIVLSADLFFDGMLIERIVQSLPNCILTENRENRELNSLNCSINDENKIVEMYQGARHSSQDVEAIGIYKISDIDLLRNWKKNCFEHPNLFCGQNLKFDLADIFSIDLGNNRFEEVNNVIDYLRIIENNN